MVIGTMARAKTKGTSKTRIRPGRWLIRFIGRWLRRIALTLVALICLGVSLYTFVNPPTTFYQMSESIRLGGIDRDWVPIEDMAPVMARSVVAAEDANFCLHWGFDMAAIRQVWSKRRIVEVYLNVVEFDEGVFGAEAAAQHYFGVSSRDLTATQAALLAAVLPDPKGRDASRPSSFMQRRSASIRDGAETIRVDGRSDCFED